MPTRFVLMKPVCISSKTERIFYVAFNMSFGVHYDWDYNGIVLDIDNGKTPLPDADDISIWLFRNGSFYEQRGAGASYWEFTTASGWSVCMQSTEAYWTTEFNITYDKIGVIAGVDKSLGVLFWSLDYQDYDKYQCWPWIDAPWMMCDLCAIRRTGEPSIRLNIT